jgi:predicted transcriptional regulator
MGRSRQEDVHIEQRRRQIATLYLKGTPQAEIARELGVSQGTVSSDLKAIRREWRDSRIRDFDEVVDVELKKIDQLEREAWSGWERSQQPAETTKVTLDGAGKKAQKVTQQQTGDPRFLEQIQRCIATRRALLGLDAPTRIAPTSPDGQESYHVYVMAELMRLSEAAASGPPVIDAEYIARELNRPMLPEQCDGIVPNKRKEIPENEHGTPVT